IKIGITRIWSVVIVFVLFLMLIILFAVGILPNLLKQIAQLLANLPNFLSQIEKWTHEFLQQPYLKNIDIQDSLEKLDIQIGPLIRNVLTSFSTSLSSIISSVAS